MENKLKNIGAILSMTPVVWEAIAQLLPDHLVKIKPKPGEWSARECLVHMLDTERVNTSRVHAFQAGQDFPAFNPDSEGTRAGEDTLAALVKKFSAMRKASLELFDTIQPDDLQRQVRHAELGPVHLIEMLNEWAGHDLNHTIQAERALAQPFMRQSGPWQVYFQDHLVSE